MHLIDDFRSALRSLSRAPSFSFLVVAVLSLGIGASTAMFSAVNALLLNAVPYENADRLTMLWDFGPDGGASPVTFGTFKEIQSRAHAFDSLAVMRAWSPSMHSGMGPERVRGQQVSADFFRTLSVQLARGHGFDPEQDRPRGELQVVLSDALWRTRFGADSSIVGTDIELDEVAYRVVGIMPPSFRDVLAPSAQLWSLLQYDPNLPDGREWGKHLRLVARLSPSISMESARQELASLAATPDERFVRPAHASLEQGVVLNRMQDDLTRGVRPGLVAAFAAVGLLLVIACVNVINLLLVRGAQRSREFAARAALGAGPGRLLRQQLIEVLALSSTGAVGGLALAYVSLESLSSLSDASASPHLQVDGTSALFAVSVATLAGLLVGLLPAIHAARMGSRGGLKPNTQRGVGGQRRARGALVVLEVSLAVVLLVSAGLLLNSLHRLFAVDAGFQVEQLLSLQVHASGERYPDDQATDRFFQSALVAVQSQPGVQAAAFTNQMPLSEDNEAFGTHFEVMPGEPSGASYNTLRYAVSPGYFETMGIPVEMGRGLVEADSENAAKAVVISRSLARKRFGEVSPIGHRLHIGAPDGPWFTVVGVVGDVRQASLASSQTDAVYVSSPQWHFADATRTLVLRFHGDSDAVASAARQAIWSVDPDRPITRVATAEQLMASTAQERRFASVVFAAFGIAALMLAAMGIYSALSDNVTERTGEIGLRMALGARREVILRWVLGQALALIGLGVVFGLLFAAGTTSALQALLFEVSARDPMVFAAVAGTLTLIGLIACLAPLRKALSVQPAQTLRWE